MRYVPFGRTGLSVSALCLGTMGFGGRGGPTHPWALDEEASLPFFRRAVESGINFFDTADHYNHGASERITGRALKLYARRDEIVVATKVGLSMGDGPNRRGLSRKHVLESVDASLTRLGTDHVDLLYVHRLDPATPDDELIDALDTVVRAGKVIYPAASSMWTWQFARLRERQRAAGAVPFVAMQDFHNLLYREEEREMHPYCAAEGVAVVPWSPLARGFLAGNRSKAGEARTDRAGKDRLSEQFFGSDTDHRIVDELAAVAGELGRSPAEVAYAWSMSRPAVTAPIVGVTKLEQLDQAVAAVDLALPDEAVARLEARYAPRAVMGHS